jgi:toxin ParE1/3/4
VRRIHAAHRAELDIAEAAAYLDRETGTSAFGSRLVADLQRVMYPIAENPQMGRAREDLQEGFRGFPHGHYTIFWRLHDDAIEIVRVLHQRQDVEREFGVKQ